MLIFNDRYTVPETLCISMCIDYYCIKLLYIIQLQLHNFFLEHFISAITDYNITIYIIQLQLHGFFLDHFISAITDYHSSSCSLMFWLITSLLFPSMFLYLHMSETNNDTTSTSYKKEENFFFKFAFE